MDNVLTHAVKEVHILGHQDIPGNVFHIAMTGTADYIPYGWVMMSQSGITRIFLWHFISLSIELSKNEK